MLVIIKLLRASNRYNFNSFDPRPFYIRLVATDAFSVLGVGFWWVPTVGCGRGGAVARGAV